MMDTAGMIYLARCCATTRSGQIMSGQKQVLGLSEAGRKQADLLGQHLAARGISAIYASPLARSVQTARIIAKHIDVPLTFCTSLLELDTGGWEGESVHRLLRQEHYHAFLRDPESTVCPEGEDLSQVARRAVNFIKRIAAEHPTDRVLLISHDYVNRALLCHFCGVPLERAREFDQGPGCVNLVRIHRGELELRAVNRNSELALAEEAEPCTDSHSTTHVSLLS